MEILFGLIGPFLVWPVELFFPYPYIVEELFKALVVKFTHGKIKSYFVAGILFALTETVFYSLNINKYGEASLFFKRLTLTSLLHATTFSLIYLGKKDKKIYLGFLSAALLHYLYNSFFTP